MSNELVVVKNEALETATIEEDLTSLNLQVGESVNLFDGIIECTVTPRFSMIIGETDGIREGKDGYYKISMKILKDGCIQHKIQRVTNFIIEPKSKIILQDFNRQDKMQHVYEVAVKVDNKINNVTLSNTDFANIHRFEEKVSEYAHILNTMSDNDFKIKIASILSKNVQTITEYKTAGYNLIENKQIFVTANSIHSYGVKSILSKSLRLNKEAVLKPVFKQYSDIMADENIKANLNLTNESSPAIVVSALLSSLFNMLQNAYNNKIEPYMVIAMCFMTLFLKQISNDFEGTPIVVLYGEAASGKSNLLRLIASAFGLDKSVLHGGMDTTAGIIEDLENYVNIPLLIDEIELTGVEATKGLVKSVYGQTGRKKYNCKNNINTTLFFNTNNKFLYDLEYKNRCIELTFSQENFNPDEAERFNYLQQYLSFVSQYIIENVPYSDIKEMIKAEEKSAHLSSVKDNRIKRNMATAITGLKLLIKLINSDTVTFEQFEENLNAYISETINMCDDDVNKFIAVLKELLDFKRGRLIEKQDYCIDKDGIHILIGKSNETFKNHFKNIFERFYKGSKPLDFKAYQKLLVNKGAVMKNMHYSAILGTRYGLYLPFKVFDDLLYLSDRLLDCEKRDTALEKDINEKIMF